MDKVYVVIQGNEELYYVAMEDPDDRDETIYEDTTVCQERIVGVFGEPSAAIQYMVEKSKERIEWMSENSQPYLTKEIYPWTIVEDRPNYYAVLLIGKELEYSEYLKFISYDVK